MSFPIRLLSPVVEYVKNNSLSIYLAAGALVVVLAALFIAKAVISSRGKKTDEKKPPVTHTSSAEKLPKIHDKLSKQQETESAAEGPSPEAKSAAPSSVNAENNAESRAQPSPESATETVNAAKANETADINPAENASGPKNDVKQDETASALAENLPTDAFDKQDETASAPRAAENIPPEKETEKEEPDMKKKDETAKKTAAEKQVKTEPAKKPAKKTATAPARMKARVAETVPVKPAPAKEKPAEAPVSTGMHGKWRIAETQDGFVASLYASNGVLMLNSEAYTTDKGAKNGIDTIKKNAENGTFQIKQDKNGRFNFKLFSLQKRLICIGASYPTRSSCESAIESVKNFAKTAILVPNDTQEQKAE